MGGYSCSHEISFEQVQLTRMHYLQIVNEKLKLHLLHQSHCLDIGIEFQRGRQIDFFRLFTQIEIQILDKKNISSKYLMGENDRIQQQLQFTKLESFSLLSHLTATFIP